MTSLIVFPVYFRSFFKFVKLRHATPTPCFEYQQINQKVAIFPYQFLQVPLSLCLHFQQNINYVHKFEKKKNKR